MNFDTRLKITTIYPPYFVRFATVHDGLDRNPGMTVVRRTPYRNTVQNSQLRRKVTTLIPLHHEKLQSTLQPAAEVLTFLEASATECQLELSCHSLRCRKVFTPGWLDLV